MKQEERLRYLLSYLMKEQGIQESITSYSLAQQKQLLRSLMNQRMPMPIDQKVIRIQNEYLQEELKHKNIISLSDMTKVQEHVYLYRGDITCLQVDAIVNAANTQMLGCFIPCHGCIDNAIHSFAGIQLRLACNEIMRKRGKPFPCGEAMITSAYELPSTYIIHTVGPIIYGAVTETDQQLLRNCYKHCLCLARTYAIHSLAFCCISTGEFHYPNEEAAKIAIETVLEDQAENQTKLEVIFNVFKKEDEAIYRRLLCNAR